MSIVDAIALAYDSFLPQQTTQFKLRLNVFNNAMGAVISNSLNGYYQSNGKNEETTSVPAKAQVLGKAVISPKNDDYSKIKANVLLNKDIYLEAVCAQCNTRRSVKDRLLLRIESVSKDSQGKYTIFYDAEEVVAVETGVDTGVFRLEKPLPTRSRKLFAIEKGNKIMESAAFDQLQATILYCLEDDSITPKKDDTGAQMNVYADPINKTGKVQTSLLVDPFGMVFNSQTGEAINGAVVTLFRVENGTESLAEVFDDDGKVCFSPTAIRTSTNEACQGTITTGASDINGDGVIDSGDAGLFRFPLVLPTNGTTSFYRLKITPPVGYGYPSVVAPSELAKFNRVIRTTGDFRSGDDDGSYGGRFDVTPDKAL
ncbi:MAG: hypothetical protein IPG70_04940 [Moraxellaceae bacterium]|nr:hypothetical protein [Moraxellaceae bacterium]